MSTPSDTASVLAARTLALARIPSPSGEEAALADHLLRLLGDRTRPAFLRRHGNALVAGYGFDPAERPPRLALVGHLDTVPRHHHPDPEIRGEEVVGLGTTDMKGALAVMATLAETLSKEPEADGVMPFALVLYDCEEIAFARNGLRRLFPLEPWLGEVELALIMEPTSNVLELGCLGTLHARVTFHGVAAHSARPWTGENAIHKAGPFLSSLAAMDVREVAEGPAVYREVISATMAEGGNARNVVPDRFTLNLNLRFAPDRTPEAAEHYLRSLVPAGASVEITDVAPAAPPRLEAPLLTSFLVRSGITARAKQAWTDVAQFAAHGVPAANFGPGDPELAHKTEERVRVEALVRSLDVLRAFVREGAAEQ
jgi:succinyl-diaminopimelate desuccinylase